MVFLTSILAFLTTFLSSLITLLPSHFEGLAPWIADVAPQQNATMVASSSVFPSPWTGTEIYINVSAVVVPLPSALPLPVFSSVLPPPVFSPVSPLPVSSPVPAPSSSPDAQRPPASKPKEPSFTHELFNLLRLISKAILRATLAVNDFLVRHNLVQLGNQRVTLSWTRVLSDGETPRGKQLVFFRFLRNARLRRQRKCRHQWGMDPTPTETDESPAPPPPPPGPAPTPAYLAALGTIKDLLRRIEDLEKKLEQSTLANDELRKELRKTSVAPPPPLSVSPSPVAAVVTPVPAVAVSCLRATAPGFQPVSSASPSVPAVSCPKATAPDFRPAIPTPPAAIAVSCPQATAPAFRPVAAVPHHLRPQPLLPTGPPPPRVVQPIYGAQYDAAAYQYQQQQMQLERERRAFAQWTQHQNLPGNPAQATEMFRRQFPNHGKKA